MAEYLHGTYSAFADHVSQGATQGGTVAVYIGTAPVNLTRGFADRVNAPVKLSSFADVRRLMGYSKNWANFDLCEAFKAHFDNPLGNIGPIVAINVLDPATHKKADDTTVSLTFVNGRAIITSDTIILDTLTLADHTEGEDFAVTYDTERGMVIIDSIGEAITGSVSATYGEVDPAKVTAETIIGAAAEEGQYIGLGCVALVYQECGVIPNIILCPKWSGTKAVFEAMIAAGTKINGHWDAVVRADIPLSDGEIKIDTKAAAIKWAADNGYNIARNKPMWPQAVGSDGNIYHLSTLWAWAEMMVDATHDGIPMETASNKPVPVVKQYFGADSTKRGFDQSQANELNANGISTVVFWGGRFVLWGPHTGAYKHDKDGDPRNNFDTNIRMMMYVGNSFQAEHALTIDRPMTRAMADTIRNREQEKADALAAVGAIIGTPVVEFVESDNSTAEMVQGNFVWGRKETYTPPMKSATLNIGYTTDGFNSYFKEVE